MSERSPRGGDLRPALALLGLAAAFALALASLLALRMEHGDVYPRYSTLRADPSGAKALHDALALAGLRVGRLYRPLERTGRVPGAPDDALAAEGGTLFVLDLPAARVSAGTSPESDALEAFAIAGGRVVLALRAVDRRPDPTPRPTTAPGPAPAPSPTPAARGARTEPPPGEGSPDEPLRPSLAGRLGLAIGFAPRSRAEAARGEAVPASGAGVGTGPIPLRTALRLRPTDPRWQVLWERDGEPVVVERRLGRGSIVVAADPYALGNRALREQPRPAYIARLLGPVTTPSAHTLLGLHTRRVLFDEAQLGVREQPGTMTLVRRHRLHGVVLALLVIAALGIWRAASPLVPPQETAGGDGAVRSGRDQGEALTALLRRSVPPADLVRVCLAEWRRTEGRSPEPARLAELAGSEAETEPAAAYRRIARTLEERRLRGKRLA